MLRCPHRLGIRLPAMVAPIVNVDGELTGVHNTYLRADGIGKHPFSDKSMQRECCGVVRGGAIRLAENDPQPPADRWRRD
jgi:hypothetical protein